jgi:hypothetical protein
MLSRSIIVFWSDETASRLTYLHLRIQIHLNNIRMGDGVSNPQKCALLGLK